jgi:cobalt-zinc-cadmium efflux system protein
MSHDHHQHRLPAERLKLALILTMGILGVEVVGGIWTGSLALLSDAAHVLTDVVALALALTAVHFSQRPADHKRTFGYYRFEILAATFNAVLLFLAAMYIFYEAIQRFMHPTEITAGWMMVVAITGLLVNLLSLRILQSGSKDNLNVRTAALEVYADLIGSIGVVVGAIIIQFTQWLWVDPVIGVLLSFWVLPRTWKVLDESLNILLEGVPPEVEIQKLYDDLATLSGVESVHDLHVWALTSGQNMMTVHLVVPGEKAELSLVKSAQHIARNHNIEHASIQVESPDTLLLEQAPHNIHTAKPNL